MRFTLNYTNFTKLFQELLEIGDFLVSLDQGLLPQDSIIVLSQMYLINSCTQ